MGEQRAVVAPATQVARRVAWAKVGWQAQCGLHHERTMGA